MEKPSERPPDGPAGGPPGGPEPPGRGGVPNAWPAPDIRDLPGPVAACTGVAGMLAADASAVTLDQSLAGLADLARLEA